MTVDRIRDAYLDRLRHIRSTFDKLCANVGRGRIFDFPDVHKLCEGLFLSSWTYWEGFLRDLLERDLADDPRGKLRMRVRQFRSTASMLQLAQGILNHPDQPDKFIDWEYGIVQKRASEFLGTGHRFVRIPQSEDLVKMKRVRNAIAHRSDKAWDSFRKLASGAPFGLSSKQLRGLTPGRFLYAHLWSGMRVQYRAIEIFRDSTQLLVP